MKRYFLILFVLCSFWSVSQNIKVEQERLLSIVNEYRSQGYSYNGTYYPPCKPLKLNDKLSNAAKIHADDMISNNFFDHVGSDGSRMGVRIERSDFKWFSCGENIAKGMISVDEAMSYWMKSPRHCKNIMMPNFDFMGFYWTGKYMVQVFAQSE